MVAPDHAIRQALATVVPDALGCDLISAHVLQSLTIDDDAVSLALRFGYPCDTRLPLYRRQVEQALAPVLGGRALHLTLDWQVQHHRAQQQMAALPNVRNVIAVASGKGGVGKSTTAVNLALALAAEGARVGMLDADIFGPSLPLMLGLPEGTRPGVQEQKYFLAPQAHGIEVMSIGFLVDATTPVVWRGPKASGALQQLVTQTLWRDLDYLIVDLPPGTGDIQLTLAQRVPVSGSVVVTTPQDVALLDARKGIEMFRKVGISVLGVVENMAVHVCSQCGHAEHVFGEGGGAALAEQYQTTLLGSLPLATRIRAQADQGTPLVVAQPDSAEAALYMAAARRLAGRLSLQARGQQAFARMVMTHTPQTH
ncbi:Mrp/Nbp35 family ATP-binding protein [Isoalcanivorax pacificus W11-5]|uniref:Iron-sulfur cluster carrier protein n=1 Tax=Isoalcanivorax pacificus W11-5 TaxID=391936 RepID=A0A0B4XNP2_9GAMM|nr:iron-sulfur cluster carrier protein ApbC [Isoalcanivorax pacificus]AJD48731.1 Mrp/Nbp35 family ATP-binding protein [Isoalcanivorax pacificus W11-5]